MVTTVNIMASYEYYRHLKITKRSTPSEAKLTKRSVCLQAIYLTTTYLIGKFYLFYDVVVIVFK